MKNKKKFILLGILILIIIIVVIAFVIKKTPKQNLIYSSNGRLYLLADNKELGRGKIESIKYSHDTDIFLFKIENDLYLYKDDAIKIIENAKSYDFKKDKIAVLDIDNKLYLYDKELIELEENIDILYKSSEDYIIYSINQMTYAYDIKKNSKEEICKDCTWISISESNNYILYIKDGKIIRLDIETKKEETIAENVKNFTSNSSYEKILYLDNDNVLYYYDSKENKKIANDATLISNKYLDDDIIFYNNQKDNKLFLYYDDNNIEIEQDDQIKNVLISNKKIYIQAQNGKIYEYNINDKKISVYDSNVFGEINKTKNGVAYVKYDEENNENNLYEITNNKKEEISKNIVITSLVADEKNEILYYIKEEDDKNNLYKYQDNKEIQIDSNIYKYYVLDNKEVYYIKDYKNVKELGTLYKYNKKTEKILDDVSDITGFVNLIEQK